MQRTLSLEIGGMSCDGCVASVKKVLSRVPGATVSTVAVGSASLALEDDGVTEHDVVRAIEKAGFSARVTAP